MEATINKADLISVRPAAPGDHNFIMATMLRGLYYGDSWFSLIPKNIFMVSYHAAIERLLARPGTTIRVACLKEDPEVILGYSVFRVLDVAGHSVTVLDFIFVKTAWRKIGVGKGLLPYKVHAVSHLTKLGKILLPKLEAIFNPFA